MRRDVDREELLIPLLALGFGVFLLAVGLRGGPARATEGGLGMLAFVFGVWSLVKALRSRRA